MNNNRAGTLEVIAVQLARFLGPLADLLSTESVLGLLAELGFAFPEALDEDPEIVDALAAARENLRALPLLSQELGEAAEAGNLAQLASVSGQLTASFGAVTGALTQVGDRLRDVGSTIGGFTQQEMDELADSFATNAFNWSAVTNLEETLPILTALADLTDAVHREERQVGSNDPNKPQYTVKRLMLSRVAGAMTDPEGRLRELYGWGEQSFDGVDLFRRLESILSRMAIPVLNDETATPPFLDAAFVELTVATGESPPGISALLKAIFGLDFENTPAPGGISTAGSLTVGAPLGTRLIIEPGGRLSLRGPGGADTSATLSFSGGLPEMPKSDAIILLGRPAGPRLELAGLEAKVEANLVWDAGAAEASGRLGAGLTLQPLRLIVDVGEADGLVSELTSGRDVEAIFDLTAQFDEGGLRFSGGSTLQVVLPLQLQLGPVRLDAVALSIGLQPPDVQLDIGVDLTATLGPVKITLLGLGVTSLLSSRDSHANGFPVDFDIALKRPTGAGITIDAGAVRGGGFLFLDIPNGRYSGALELNVFGIAVKAFGLIETKFPDGSEGFSFVVVIVAEFTPIQLGFGFTLIGVGGLLGVNRSVNQEGLGTAVRTGSLEHLLFPRNPVRDAPAIVHDLGTVFPATRGHTILGPLGKLGWGTPTLISADLGIIIEFPGPRLALLGVVRMALPSPDAALLRLQMAIGGFLDFPKKRMSLNASLYDSHVVSFAVSGDMAYQLNFGRSAKFLMSVGGFNPSFNAPPEMPDLRRASVSLGVNGNPSLVASGYFALTSNTAQFGASIELNARGGPARLHGWLSCDALFVFSPFSFAVSISAGMKVSVWGKGIGVTLRGDLSGPSPWHVKGKVCVSLLFAKACVSVDHKFGRKEPAALPEMDPWVGTPPETDPRIAVRGLLAAIQDPRSWSGSSPPAGFAVVSLAAAATNERTPIDPLGAATLRQRVAPLNMKLEKFGEYRPIVNDQFNLTSVVMNEQLIGDDERENVEDDFAPGHFMELSNSEKLSMESYELMDAGISIAPNRLDIGSVGSQVLEYETELINDQGQVLTNQPVFTLTAGQLRGLLGRSAAALGGIRASGTQKYVVAGRSSKVTLGRKRFVVVDACASVRNASITPEGISQVQALLALRNHVANHPADAGLYRVAPLHEEKLAA